jgi:hypothetical protein
MKTLPLYCPSCGAGLSVERLSCRACGTEVGGSYLLPGLAGLSKDDQDFVGAFVKCSGNLKETAAIMNAGYSAVRNRLDKIIEKLNQNKSEGKE